MNITYHAGLFFVGAVINWKKTEMSFFSPIMNKDIPIDIMYLPLDYSMFLVCYWKFIGA